MQQYARERWQQRQKKYQKLAVNSDGQPTVSRRSTDSQSTDKGENEAKE
jgi:hypothetical protein